MIRAGRRRRVRLRAVLIVGALTLALPAAVLAARAWTLSASPTTLPAGSASTVTLTIRNVGGNGGGDEITCVQVSVPPAFTVASATIASVKGVTSAAAHGWLVVTGSATGRTIVTFKNPSDRNPLVGLPAGDSAVFQISGTASSAGLLTWTAVAADKPGGSTSTSCGSGTFPTISLTFSVAVSPTPSPTPRPTPTPTPTPSFTPVPTTTPGPTPTKTPRPTARPTPTPTAIPTPIQPVSPTPTPAPSATPVPSPTGSVAPSPTASPIARPGALPPVTSGGGSGPSTTPGGDGTAGGAHPTDQLAIPLPSPGAGRREVIAGLDATVQTAFLDMGIVGWTVPALALSVPGIIVVIVVALQLVGGLAWLPLARRLLSRTTVPSGGRAGPHRDLHSPGG